ncbi:hypothetical protein ACFXTO_003570 [Malus domestica]
MPRFKIKKKVFVKSVSTKKQANVDHITGDKIPRSFVFSRCKLPGPLKQLQADLRKLMLPYTALKLKEKMLNKKSIQDNSNDPKKKKIKHTLKKAHKKTLISKAFLI